MPNGIHRPSIGKRDASERCAMRSDVGETALGASDGTRGARCVAMPRWAVIALVAAIVLLAAYALFTSVVFCENCFGPDGALPRITG